MWDLGLPTPSELIFFDDQFCSHKWRHFSYTFRVRDYLNIIGMESLRALLSYNIIVRGWPY